MRSSSPLLINLYMGPFFFFSFVLAFPALTPYSPYEKFLQLILIPSK